MTRQERADKVEQTLDRLLDQVNASIDFGKPGDAADYASAFKDVFHVHRDIEDE